MMRRKDMGAAPPEAVNGIIDCIFALGAAFANAALISRADLAETFRIAAEQGARRQAEIGGDPAMRAAAARALAQSFGLPLAGAEARAGFRVIAGGAPGADGDDPPPAAA